MNDWELLVAFAAGDGQALDALVKKYFSTVYSAAVRQVDDHHLAEDVAQSVFILFREKPPNCRSPSRWAAGCCALRVLYPAIF
jgi:DNA-directed RNA polymerase specialized sigma24 family protein